MEDIRLDHATSPDIQQLVQKLQADGSQDNLEFKEGILFFKGKIYLSPSSPLTSKLLSMLHHECHEGYQKTLHRIARDFYWPGMKRSIQDFVRECVVCQRNKVEHLKPARLLQPLPVPHQVWSDISMDFITGLPRSQGKTVLFVIVDRFSKHAHFIPLAHPYTAVAGARVFFAHNFKLHGLPETIVSDRDATFTSSFWQELFRLSGTQLCFSSAYHLQSDGQTEAVNRVIEMYLRCFTGDFPTKWVSWLPWVEFCYNTGYHTSLRATPFEIVYGRPPPRLLSYIAGNSRIEAVDFELQNREQFLKNLRDRLLTAQNRMKNQYDSRHREVSFAEGDMILLKLQPYRQISVPSKHHSKLSPRFYGPFKVLARVGSVAYKLQLPVKSKLHPVFHVSSLKKFHGNIPSTTTLQPIQQEEFFPCPQAVLDQLTSRGRTEILVHWEGLSPAEASWEDTTTIMERYPTFVFADKPDFEEGSNVMGHEHTVCEHAGQTCQVESTTKELEPVVYKRHTHGKFGKKATDRDMHSKEN